jgi:guanylate kinase
MSAPVIIITGPSAAGKTTVVRKLLQRKTLNLKRFVTCTTRPKRKGEVNHRDYHFLSEQDFKKAIKSKEMMEYSKVYGHYYGSRKKDFEKDIKGKKALLLIIDIQGVKKLKKLIPTCCILFIDISKKTLLKRLKDRGSNIKDVALRIKKYDKEEAAKSIASKVIINRNGKLAQTVNSIATLIKFGILKQERAKKA